MSLSQVERGVRRAQSDVLQSLRRDLRDVLIPDLGSDAAKATAGLMDEMLGWVALALNHDELGAASSRVSPDTFRADFAAADEMNPDEEALAQAMARADAVRRDGSRTNILEHVRAEAATMEAQVQAATALAAKLTIALDRAPEAATLSAWLAKHLPQLGPVAQLQRVVGGYSKDTWIITLAAGRELVLRRDLPFGPGENSVVDEFEILRRLAGSGVPAPSPLAVEPDPAVAGAPFLLFHRSPGRAIFDQWSADPEEKRAIALEVAACLAQFHCLPPEVLGLKLRDGTAAVAELVENWRQKWERRRLYPSAVLEAAFGWLAQNIPNLPAPATLVHGDVSFRNTLIDNGRLVALLDWEFHHLGDPVEDLSYFRLVAEPFVPWEDVKAAYRAAGGPAYDESRARFYDVWRSTRNAVTTATAWHGFVHGYYPASKAAYQGLSLHRFFLRDVAEKLETVL